MKMKFHLLINRQPFPIKSGFWKGTYPCHRAFNFAVLSSLFMASILVLNGRSVDTSMEDETPRVRFDRYFESIDHPGSAKTATALEEIGKLGTNALPRIVEIFRMEDSPMQRKLKDWILSISKGRIDIRRDYHWYARAAFAAKAIGASAIPALTEFFDSTNYYRNFCVRSAIVGMGNEAVAPLVNAMTNRNVRIRMGIIDTLFPGPGGSG